MKKLYDKDGKCTGFELDEKESSNFASWLTKKIKEDKPVETETEERKS